MDASLLRRSLLWTGIFIAALAAAVVIALYGLYGFAGRDLPRQLPLPTHEYPTAARRLAWVSMGGSGEPRLPRYNPVSYAWATYDELRTDPTHRTSSLRPLSVAARNLAPRLHAPQRNASRHLTEAALSIRLSREWSVERIVDSALDDIYFAPDLRGLSAASSIYFGTAPSGLTDEETVALLTLARSPAMLDPACHPERFLRTYRVQLTRSGLDDHVDAVPPRMRVEPCMQRS